MDGSKESTTYSYVVRAHQLCLDLNDIMMLINSSHDTDEILNEVVEESSKALGCESARIAMREDGHWVIRHVSNLPVDLVGQTFTDEELPHAVLAMITRKPVAIDDAFNDDKTNNEMMKSLGMRSVMVLPLMEKGEVTGTLSYGYHSKAVSFTDAEIDYAERIATGVALALQDARLYQELEETRKLTDALNEIDTILFSAMDYVSTMDKILQLGTDVIGAESAVIFSREGDRWMVRHEYKLPLSLMGQTFSNTEVMHTAVTAGTKRSLVVQDAVNSPEIDQKFVEMLGIRSLLDFPLILKGEVIGDLTFHYHSSPIPFNERQIEFVRKLQISLTLALENNRLLDTFKESESRLKEAEKLGHFGYFDYDVDTRRIIWSEGVFHIFGRDPVLGEPTVEEFFALYSVDPGQDKMQELTRNKETSEIDATITRGDRARHCHFVIRSIKDDNGNVVTYFGTIQDITERKRDEEALQESETRFHAIFNLAAVGIAQVGLNGQWMTMNQKLSDILGYSFDDLGHMTLQQVSHPDDIEPDMAHIRRLLAGEDTTYTMEKRYICKDGSILWVNLNVTLVRDHYGKPEYYIAILEDINERKKAVEKVQKLNMILEERAQELEAFNYTVAHDLRGPLNSLGLSFQTIQKMYGAKLDETGREYLTCGYKNVQRMSELIDVLLEFAKLSNVEPQRENVDISAMVREIVDELKRTSPERRCIFLVADGIVANGDSKLLRVVLNNLVRNAWKYTGKREEAVIEFGATEIGGKEAYFVRDNGQGFDPTESDKLFSPFQRLPGAEEFKGSGIGLATVERIIRRHGGKVWAEGEPDKGACFYFTLQVR